MNPNRIAVYLTSLAGLATAVAVPLADLDTTSTAGLIAGLAAIAGVVSVWLKGWQKHEERESFKDERERLGVLFHDEAPEETPAP